MNSKSGERGQSLVLLALFLLFVLLPTLALVVDGARLYRARSLLQTATDAACEDAAVTAPDYEHYKRTGETRFVSNQLIWWQAYQTFNQFWSRLGGGTALEVSAYSITISPDQSSHRMDCTGQVSVPLVITPSTVTLDAATTSSVRFSSD